MNKHLERFEAALQDHRAADAWISQVKPPPHVTGSEWTLGVSVHSRDPDGVDRTHTAPPGLRRALSTAMAYHFPELLRSARAALAEEVDLAAREAYFSAKEVMLDDRIRSRIAGVDGELTESGPRG